MDAEEADKGIKSYIALLADQAKSDVHLLNAVLEAIPFMTQAQMAGIITAQHMRA